MREVIFIKDFGTAKKGEVRTLSSILCRTLMSMKVATHRTTKKVVAPKPESKPKKKSKVKKAK